MKNIIVEKKSEAFEKLSRLQRLIKRESALKELCNK